MWINLILLFKSEVYPQSLEKYVLCGLVILYMGNWSCKVQTLSYYLSFTNLCGSDLFPDPDRKHWPMVPYLVCIFFTVDKTKLKGVFAKNERGYRLNAIKKRF